ncbi:MAG: RNA methyltransferase [Anaerolineae bacterium]|nr:RNA methyltransferase [Anaerolineae bacterium]
MSEIITSTRNPRVVEARKLSQRKHRQQQGRFLVEGLQLLHMALDGGQQPQDVFYCEALFTGSEAPALLDRFTDAGATVIAVAEDVLRALSDRDTPQGIVATFTLAPPELDAVTLQGDELIIVLDRLQDPGNLGTILRTADAAGAAAVVLLTPSTDPYDPKTVRASMGSLFNLPVIQVDDPSMLFDWLQRNGLRPVGADAHQGVRWTAYDWRNGLALVLGNEARGLSDDVQAHIHDWVHLPVIGKADSLNVAIAGGVLMYAWVAVNAPA